MGEVDLTAVRDMVAALARADLEIRRLDQDKEKMTRMRDHIREQLSKLMGDNEIGLVNGVAVLKRTVSKQFAEARFRNDLPDMYELVKTFEMVEKVDRDKLGQIAPEILRKYQTLRWTNTMDIPE